MQVQRRSLDPAPYAVPRYVRSIGAPVRIHHSHVEKQLVHFSAANGNFKKLESDDTRHAVVLNENCQPPPGRLQK